jgi:hypothetical protein
MRKSAREVVLNTARPRVGVALIEPQWRITATVEQASTALMRAAAQKDTILVSTHPQTERREKRCRLRHAAA